MNAAILAEDVLRRIGIELVSGQRFVAAQQLEILARNGEMQDALLRADRAVALGGP